VRQPFWNEKRKVVSWNEGVGKDETSVAAVDDNDDETRLTIRKCFRRPSSLGDDTYGGGGEQFGSVK
jgi:hypothetical protein